MTTTGEPPQQPPSDDAKRRAERIVIYGYLGLIAFLVVSGQIASLVTDGRVHIEVAAVGALIGGLSGLLIARAFTK
jgi:hypothetical protein